MPALRWFDAHLDLAYLAVCGRDMTTADLAACGGPDLPAAVTIPALRTGGVDACLATIFTEAGGDNPASYPAADAAAANLKGVEQLRTYQQWLGLGLASPMGQLAPLSARESTGISPARTVGTFPAPTPPMTLGILIEGADPVLSPDDLPSWIDHGVVAVGLAWAHGSRYAGGNSHTTGLTDSGRALVRSIDAAGVVHDLSHLSDAAMDELLSLSAGRIIASHSNCRALFTGDASRNQRHLRDDSIREIARRGGVVGLNLFSPFINPDGSRERRATLADAVRHVRHVCDLAGHTRAVGLGSDMDGGFSACSLPAGIDVPEHLFRLADALAAGGFCDDDIHAFAWHNWARFWGLSDR